MLTWIFFFFLCYKDFYKGYFQYGDFFFTPVMVEISEVFREVKLRQIRECEKGNL